MSHCNALVRLADGTILHGVYDSVVDYAIPMLHIERDGMLAHWHAAEARHANCPVPASERADYWTSYAGGIHTDVLVCRRCRVITSQELLDFDTSCERNEDPKYGQPPWVSLYLTRHYVRYGVWHEWRDLDEATLWEVAAPTDRISLQPTERYLTRRALDELERRGLKPSTDDLHVAWDRACQLGYGAQRYRPMPRYLLTLWALFRPAKG